MTNKKSLMESHNVQESLIGINLRAEMDDGSWWEVPAKFIALKAADSQTSPNTSIEEYSNTVNEFLNNEEKILDWAEENMTWDDVLPLARLVRPPRTSKYSRNWKNGMKMLIKHN